MPRHLLSSRFRSVLSGGYLHPSMHLFPAIDLRGGACVRLLQGRADAQTTYSQDPAAVAESFRAAGASWIHVVDLDGAFDGEPRNRVAVRAILGAGLKVQLGGGMRSRDRVAEALALGVSRIVTGTKAAEDPAWLGAMAAEFGDRIAVGIDAKEGKVATRGWVRPTDLDAVAFAVSCTALGIRTFIYTDIATDGMLTGPNFAGLEAMLRATSADVIASGGISGPEDLHRLAELAKSHRNLAGVIAGKAIYEGRLSAADGVRILGG